MPLITTPNDIREIFTHTRIAILGAHVTKSKPAYYVADYLHQKGFDIYPVNPVYAGQPYLDKSIYASLADVPVPIDIVDIFRRSEHLADHVHELLAMQPRPKVVWFQLGITNHDVAKTLSKEGIGVVQNRCMLADHKTFNLE